MYTKDKAEKNERLFRELNERIREVSETLQVGPPHVEFICECAREGCLDRIELTLAEYGEVRANPAHFALVSGHELLDVETVIAKHERFTTVSKPWLA